MTRTRDADMQHLATVATEVWQETYGEEPLLVVVTQGGRIAAAAPFPPTADELRVAAARLLETADALT